MKNNIPALKNRLYRFKIGDIKFKKFRFWMKIFTLSSGQIVQYRNIVTAAYQSLH